MPSNGALFWRGWSRLIRVVAPRGAYRAAPPIPDSDPSQRLHPPRGAPAELACLLTPPYQIARICELVATKRFELSFSPGLLDTLTEHIATHHAADIPIHNAGLAVNLNAPAQHARCTRGGWRALGRGPVQRDGGAWRQR